MSHSAALEPAAPSPSWARLAALELELAARERDLAAFTRDLQDLQTRYLAAVGGSYAELVEVESACIALEVELGLRPPVRPDAEPDGRPDGAPASVAGCGTRAAPPADLKKMFREIARTIHPDLALDDPARWRRHSLMAEANRAYAEQDEDRLRLILATWQRSGDAVLDSGSDADEQRVQARIAAIETRLLAITAEFADLEASAIRQLARKIDDARRQGWDLLAEMVLEVKREVARAKARLASLRRTAADAPRPSPVP